MVKRTSWGWGAICCSSAHEAGPEFPPCDKWRSSLFSLAPVNWIRQDACGTGLGNPQEPADRRERARWRSGAPSNFEAVVDVSGPFIGNSSSLPWLSVGMALDRRDLSKWTCPVVVSTFVDSSLISLACASLKSDELSQEELKGLTWLRGALFQTKLICRLSSNNDEGSLAEAKAYASGWGFRRRALWSDRRLLQLLFFWSNSDRAWNLDYQNPSNQKNQTYILGIDSHVIVQTEDMPAI